MKQLFISTLLLALGTAFALTQEKEGAESRSTRQGIYTPEQARRGEKVAEEKCEHCHPPAFYKGRVIEAWTGNTIGAMYDNLVNTMPEDRPSSLKPQQYADIVAYILELNQYPAGKDELQGDKKELERIVIERRTK